MEEIKQAGGITMVRNPEGLPGKRNRYGGIVDVIAPTADLARAIERYLYGV